MDPITLFFASYLEAISDKTYQQIHDPQGETPQEVMVSHGKQQVFYRYRHWEIDTDSVCADRRENLGRFSNCTLAAKTLFGEACLELQLHPEEHWKYLRLREMYCTAASEFQPTIAAIDWEEEETELSIAKRECSMATAAAIGSSSPSVLKRRDVACARYRQMKERLGKE